VFFVEYPYISEFIKKTVHDNKIPVVATEIAKKLALFPGTTFISEEETIELVKKTENPIIYTTSENAIDWISKNLAFSALPDKIKLFKDKLVFRELTKSVFPGFTFKEVRLEDLNKIDFPDLPLPFIIKPSVGFFSMGVYKVSNQNEWGKTINSIINEIDLNKDLYPEEVLDTSSFILEECIKGGEYAIDAYYDSDGEPVILGILKHVFASDKDVSDRVYTTSREVLEDNLQEFTDFTAKIGQLAGVKNFPVHIELRRDIRGLLFPIEVNPMRFGGWCTSADLSFLAYGFNPYLYFYNQQKPNWQEILKGKEGKHFSMVVLNNSTGVDISKITSFDYEKLLSCFEKPLELRKIDFKKYPVFGFLFAETRGENWQELDYILDSDLNEFVSTK